MSKQWIRHAGGDESCGRHRVGLRSPLGGETHTRGMYLDRWTKQKIAIKKRKLAVNRKGTVLIFIGEGRDQKCGVSEGYGVRRERARSRTEELNVATWNVRLLSLTGRRGAGHAEVLLQKCKVLDCDVTGLFCKKTPRPGRTEFTAAGYRVFCSGEAGSNCRAGQYGVGLVVKDSITLEATWTRQLTNERLMSWLSTWQASPTPSLLLWHMTRHMLCPVRENRRVRFGRIWIVLLVECPAATTCYMLTPGLVFE